MDLFTSLIQPFLSLAGDASARQFGYLKAKTIIKDLAESMKDLEAKRNDIRREIEVAVSDRKQCIQQVGRWIEKVSETEGEVMAIQSDYEGSGCNLLGSRIPNFWTSYRVGRRASKLLAKVIDLEKEQADFGAICIPQPPLPVQELNPSMSTEGGTLMASYLEKVRGYLEEEGGYIIGIWGMGGVGKTTLLQAINNDHFLHHSAKAVAAAAATEGTTLFDHVIFVVVSKDHRLEKLQKDIINRLGLGSSDDVESRATIIFDFLKEKNFLLLLDDVWKAVNLRAIGIPDPACASNNIGKRHKRKVVVTTRSEEVCGQMCSRKRIKMECLGKTEAWNLFKKNINEELLISHKDLMSPAQEVAEECGGLPLALVVIGRAMSAKRSPEAWNYATTQLRKSQPSNIPGMEDSMFATMKFSYDSLPDDRTRGCFLCCSLWPEGEKIVKAHLIMAWMGLDLIDDFDDITEAYNLGHFVIESLIAASLLEPVEDDDHRVKMHDVIRDLALWIACDCGKERNRWLVRARVGVEDVSSDMATKWREAEQVSLMYNDIQELPRNLPPAHCPNLSVLILHRNYLREIPLEFFRCMPNLTHLDLSSNSSLKEIPIEFGCLVKLRYLNLSFTNISSLPDELGQLSNLKYLLLGYTHGPVSIPMRVLSSLSKLEFLELFPQTELFSYDDDDQLTPLLRGLKAVGVKIKSFKNLRQLFLHKVGIMRLRMEDMGDSTSFHLRQLNSVTRGCIQELIFGNCCSVGEVVMDIASLPILEKLELDNLENMREIVWSSAVPSECFRSLRNITIVKCPLLKDTTWILHLPLLERLDVIACGALEQLIGVQVNVDNNSLLDDLGEYAGTKERQGQTNSTRTFPRLKCLLLEQLPKLCSICADYDLVDFPSLEYVEVDNCPELKKLPFRPQVNCRKLLQIHCSKIWWDSIEWKDEDIKFYLESLLVLFRTRT